MEIKPYKSGRKGQQVPMVFPGEELVVRSGLPAPRAESLALDARIVQEDAYCHEAGGSLRYLLLLNGVLPDVTILDDSDTLRGHIAQVAPDSAPGATGPIAILLIL